MRGFSRRKKMSNETELNSQDFLWDRAVELYKATLTTDSERSQMERHFPQFIYHKQVNAEYLIGVAEELQVDWFSQIYAQALENALHSAGLDSSVSVKFTVANSAALPSVGSFNKAEPKKPPVPKPKTRSVIASTLPLHSAYTFDNFVQGPSNSFAHAAATAVANGTGGMAYNPLFIYGGTGLGKTHLMEAIGHYVLKHSPETSVCYITSETFLNEYINAIAAGTMSAFRDRYRKVDILLLDDVQFIVGKKQFQEEFFNTFNFLLLYNKQVVMTSDVAPRNLQGLEERLISRFQQGMVVEIESPSPETRLAILKSKARLLHHTIPDEVLTYIADNIRSHVRALEGALQRVDMFIAANPTIALTTDIARRLLRDYIEEEEQIKDLEISDIIQTVASHFGVTVAGIKSSERTQTLVTPRQLAMFLCRKLTTKSTPTIADAFEKKHSTILHGAGAILKRLETEEELRKQAEKIVVELGRKPSDLLQD